MAAAAPVQGIELRLREVAQLFNSVDPTPFHELVRRELKQLLAQGRTSLVIGPAFLVLCLLAADAMSRFAGGTFLSVLRESVTIGGRVAMWRPLQIFLYEWWPITRRRRIYRNLSRAHVRVLDGADHSRARQAGPAEAART